MLIARYSSVGAGVPIHGLTTGRTLSHLLLLLTLVIWAPQHTAFSQLVLSFRETVLSVLEAMIACR